MVVLQGLSAVCANDVSSVHKSTNITKVAPVRAKKRKRLNRANNGGRGGNGASPELKRAIRMRDSHRCRFCSHSSTRLEVHHIKYLSEGGPNHEANLIALCDEHHRLVHSNKKVWQPVLLACIWIQYVGWPGENHPRRLTVPTVLDRLVHESLHPEGESVVVQY